MHALQRERRVGEENAPTSIERSSTARSGDRATGDQPLEEYLHTYLRSEGEGEEGTSAKGGMRRTSGRKWRERDQREKRQREVEERGERAREGGREGEEVRRTEAD